ncbi:Tol-Pal system peptidoglycan-associated lipoprotein PAL [hydrothermal vent metagenome]|uniref:Tol-Pal system peptidoglycan-associated lipoprotein PAL n=1 Tax=hydrothermal vent metagenome TaxID=652676 RepID=A0A3B0YX41_9ZZZZ
MKLIRNMAVALIVVVFAGCSTTGGEKDDSVVIEDRSDAAGDNGAVTTGVGGGYGDLTIESLNDPNSALSQRVIYFEYDSGDVASQDRPLVEAHAEFLAANPEIRVTVEGHADERGAREYNIGLGDQRAQAVRRMLEFQGVSPSQISTVSFGEEKPAVEGHDESAWSMNRRVELVYVGY